MKGQDKPRRKELGVKGLRRSCKEKVRRVAYKERARKASWGGNACGSFDAMREEGPEDAVELEASCCWCIAFGLL